MNNFSLSILNVSPFALKEVLINTTPLTNILHYDVMDGHFVKQISFGNDYLQFIKLQFPDWYIDCHMMVNIKCLSLFSFLEPYLKIKIDQITLHVESLTDHQFVEFFEICTKYNIKSGLAINPDTPLSKIHTWLPSVDWITIMSVQPGLGGQTFIEASIIKILELKSYIIKNKNLTMIQVDGSMNDQTIQACFKAGAARFVIGSFLTIWSPKSATWQEKIKLLNDLQL